MARPYGTGANGLPVATMQRPPVHANRSAGTASARDVGFESGKTIGTRGVRRHLADHRLGERSGLARDADQRGRPYAPHRLRQLDGSLGPAPPLRDLRFRAREPPLERLHVAHALGDQAAGIVDPEPSRGLALRDAIRDQHVGELGRDAERRGARAEQHDPLFREPAADLAHRPEQRRHGHGGGALDVVVEGAEPVAVEVEQVRRVVAREVLPLQQHVRQLLHQRLHEALDEIQVRLPAHAAAAPSQVVRIRQALLVVGADVEQQRKRAGGVDASAQRIEGELADRNAHAAAALVAEAEDALAVRHHDHVHVAVRAVVEDALDLVALRVREEQSARAADDLAEVLARVPHGRRVDHGHHLVEVRERHAVEQHLVAVLERAQVDVLLHRGGLEQELAVGALELLVEVGDVGRKQSVEAERAALVVGERSAPVVEGGLEQHRPPQLRAEHVLAAARVGVEVEHHHGSLRRRATEARRGCGWVHRGATPQDCPACRMTPPACQPDTMCAARDGGAAAHSHGRMRSRVGKRGSIMTADS